MATVVITGANRGVGLALARCYAARGHHLIALCRDPGRASELGALAKRGKGVDVLAADVTDEAALAAAAKAVGDRPVDIVICNAGVMSSRGTITDAGHDAAEWARVLASNVTGAFLTAQAFLPQLAKAKTGKLAFMSSIMASSAHAAGKVLAYRASKAAVANLGLNLSIDLKPMGIAVGIYHPGWVSSDMGGPTAPVTPQASAEGLAARIDQLSLVTTGVFEDYLGKPFSF